MKSRKIACVVGLAVLLMVVLSLGCRRSEYYHRTATDAQRQADYQECSARADQQQEASGNSMGISEYTSIIRDCMEARGYVYTD
ncbi:MAG: hypothetical protein D6E12_00445 [Desulfovibrio sp.]|nr:MAG: hypothetical protein D6E12_00445 [Desulfovibrio sp.]